MKGHQYLDQLFSYGVQALKDSDLALAQSTFHQILKEFPEHPDALNLLGVVLSKKGDHDKAVRQFARAIEKNPSNANYFLNRGLAYSKNGDATTAIIDLKEAIALNPEFAEAFYNLGNIEKGTGQLDDARKHLEQALIIQPGHAQAAYNLGNLHMEAGNYKSAIGFFERAVSSNPTFALAHNNLGIVLQEWDRWDEAEAHFTTALQVNADSSEVRRNLGLLCETQGRTEEARQHAQLLSKGKKDPWLEFHAEIICPVIPESNEEIDKYRRKLNGVLDHYIKHPPEGSPDAMRVCGIEPPSNLIYQGRDDKPVKQKFGELFSRYFPQEPNRNITTKIRKIGFVVTQGHEGVFIKCMKGLILQLSRKKFAITIICTFPNGEKILAPAIGTAQVEYLSINTQLTIAAERILRERFDVLHYWETGTDSLNYFLPFYRLAPVQCTSWGWPITSGISSMDYFISAKGLEGSDSQSCYTEKLVIMGRLPIYYYRPPLPTQALERSHFGFRNEEHLYLCTQNLRKVHPDFDSLVAEILLRDEKGHALFIEDKQKNITELFRKRITSNHPEVAKRIRILNRMDERDYLGLVRGADVILDTLYYTGGANTTYDAFSAGTPVVTLPSREHRGRFTCAACQQIGVMDTIAYSKEDYVLKALQLGTDRTYRDKTGSDISQASHAVFEDKDAVEELEQFFENVTPVQQ